MITLNVLDIFRHFFAFTAFTNLTAGQLIMICIGAVLIALAILKKYQPLLLITIGFGIIIVNIPFNAFIPGSAISRIDLHNFLYHGVQYGWYVPLLFLGIGAMLDFSALIANPKLLLIGAAAQLGVFGAYAIALVFGFTPAEAGAIGIIGAVDGTVAIFLAAKLAPELLGAVVVAAYLYIALLPKIQPPVMRALTTPKERLIHMKTPRQVSKTEKIIFPIVGIILTCFFVPSAIPLLGMLFLGNLLKESGVTDRLAKTASGTMVDFVTILTGLAVGAATHASTFLTPKTILIFGLGAVSFIVATAGGILFIKFINLFLKDGDKINPLIGNSGVSASPEVSQTVGQEYDRTNHLLAHAYGPNVAGFIGSAVAAGLLLGFLY